MSIKKIIKEREISEVLHFTTQHGLLGILASKFVMSQARLRKEQSVEHILRINTKKNFDPAWKDYVNLSISRINNRLYNISTDWHPDVWWCILSFDPVILTHPGVHFVTTNNGYFMHLRRAPGPEGLEAMFDNKVIGLRGAELNRTREMPASYTTCRQAEILYPGQLSTEYLKIIYVSHDESRDHIMAMIGGIGCEEYDVVVDPGKFN